MEVTKLIEIDLATRGVTNKVDVVQFDDNTRIVKTVLYENGLPWTVPDGVQVVVSYTKPDKTIGMYDQMPDGSAASTVEDNVICIKLAPQVMTVKGVVWCNIVIYAANGDALSTFPFNVLVAPNQQAEAMDSSNYINMGFLSFSQRQELTDEQKAIARENIGVGEGGGTGGGGTLDHNELTNRDMANQHPMSAITGLEGALAGKQPTGDYLKGGDVPAWAMEEDKPSYIATEVGADPTGTATAAVSSHNTNKDSHNDIRLLIAELTAKVTNFLDVDDTTRDQLSELLALIDANADTLETITNGKVNKTDIINNLTTNSSDKVLSAAQGVALKALIDAIPAWAKAESKPTYSKSEVGLGNVANERQYSANNPPPYPVTSVNGKTGAVALSIPDSLSDLSADSTHRTVTDAEKTTWNGKSNFSGNYADLNGKPTKVSDFTNDAGYTTKEDVEEILSDDGIPLYWDDPDDTDAPSYLTNKIARIKALQREGGKDCFSFVLITDEHYPSNLGKLSPTIAKRIMDECNIRFVLNGGDTQTRGCWLTKEEVLSENVQVSEMFAPVKDRTLTVEGNHDGSYYWSGGAVGSGTAYVKQLNENEMFEEYYRANGLSGDVHFDENSNAFYVDDISSKVRYIGLNTMNVPNAKTDVDGDGIANYTKFREYQFLQAQYDFLCNEALTTVPSDAWKVVVFGHSGIYNSGDYAVMVDVLSAYKNKTECVAEYAGTAAGDPAYTNLAEPLPDNTTDTSKWVNGYRISSSGISAQAGKTLSNPVNVEIGDVIYVKDVDFVAGEDRFLLGGKNSSGVDVGQKHYVSDLPNAVLGYELVDGVHKFTVVYSNLATDGTLRFAFTTPTNPENIIITRNEEIVESEHGYDYVSVNHDFADAKGQFVAYFHGHDHKDADYTRISTTNSANSIKDISTRCDAKEEHDEADRAERVKGTITEQSFDVFTITPDKIYATKIGAGSDREIDY